MMPHLLQVTLLLRRNGEGQMLFGLVRHLDQLAQIRLAPTARPLT